MSDDLTVHVPGWYRFQEGVERYWDGENWGEPYTPEPQEPPSELNLRVDESDAEQELDSPPVRAASRQPVLVQQDYEADHPYRSTAMPVNPKLSTLGWLSSISAVLGTVFFIFGILKIDEVPAAIGGGLIGLSLTLWLTWLSVGAVVDAIDGRKS